MATRHPRLPTKARALFALVLLNAYFAPHVPAQPQTSKEEWTWRGPSGSIRSRADLDKILAHHKLWLDSNRESGTQLSLSGADLSGAGLRDSVLSRADLSRTSLANANLSGTNLTRAFLSGANLTHTDLAGADLSGADLGGANLSEVSTSYLGARTKLVRASLRGADLSNASLSGADLSGADLGEAHLIGAYLGGADLSYAHLIGTDLSGAVLDSTVLKGVEFEPKYLPPTESIARSVGMELLRYEQNPGPLSQLRKKFQDAGYREQERAITCALNRREADELASPVERWFKRVAFDYTCQYGFTPGQPLRIVLGLWLAFAVVYAALMHWPGTSGIYLVGSRVWRGRSNSQGLQIRPHSIRAARWWKLPFLWVRQECRMLRAALFFSLMSAFNIGFRDINFGRWVRLLTTREYDLKAVGWARTVSGIQSLLSVYLIALWVLTYFGRPFQ